MNMMKSFLKYDSDFKNHFIEIDAMRGICALLVLIYHYSKYIQSLNHYSSPFYYYAEFGKYGVHLFFIISGLLIFMTLEKSKHPKDFIASRFSRLYPAYWVSMTLTAVVISIYPYYYTSVTTTQFLANLTLFQHWMHVEDIDGIYWTLAVEVCFYILIFFVFIFKKQKHIELIGTIWMAIMLILFFLVKTDLAPSLNYYYYIPLLRNGNLFLGGILFYKLLKKKRDKKTHFLLLFTLAVHFIINSAEESFVVSFFYILLYLFIMNKLHFLRINLFYFLGTICYTLYLLHQYIGYEIINYLNAIGIVNPFIEITTTGMLMIGLASLVTFYVEQPAIKFLRKKLIY